MTKSFHVVQAEEAPWPVRRDHFGDYIRDLKGNVVEGEKQVIYSYIPEITSYIEKFAIARTEFALAVNLRQLLPTLKDGTPLSDELIESMGDLTQNEILRRVKVLEASLAKRKAEWEKENGIQ